MVMVSGLCRRRRGIAFIGIAALIASCGWIGADAAPITWAKKGAFEACVEHSLNEWLGAQAELVVNEDPAAGALDDAGVARWTVHTLGRSVPGPGRHSEDLLRHGTLALPYLSR
jgi:hypothetical protein